LLPLKPGFVLIAQRAGAPLQLVRVVCNHPVLGKDRPWWQLPPFSPSVDVTIGPRLEVAADANIAAAAAEIEAWFRATPEAAACQIWSRALRVCASPAIA
jgi:1-acyl-sn-glycerol-3-phosphate acyltransferase